MTERERLHALIDTLPESEVHAALRFLEFLENEEPASRLWSIEDAPIDDEPLTAAEKQALAEAESDVAEGRVVSHVAETERGDIRHLQGDKSGTLRLRVGNWRVLFSKEGGGIVVRRVLPRGSAYQP